MLACSCTASGSYWSSTSYADDPQNAWIVNFHGGNVLALTKGGYISVRAVRGGS